MILPVKCITTNCNDAENNESHPGLVVQLQKTKTQISLPLTISTSICYGSKTKLLLCDKKNYMIRSMILHEQTWAKRKMFRKIQTAGTTGTPGQENPGGLV